MAGRYTLVGTPNQDLGKVSQNVLLVETRFNTTTPTTSWCVGVNNPAGDKKLWKYSAAGGLATGACIATTDY